MSLTRLPIRRCEISRENPHFGPGVRQIRRRYQARIWLGWLAVRPNGDRLATGLHVNLGLYETPTTARSVLREVTRRVPADAWTPVEIWRTAVACSGAFSGDAALVLRELLPMWVTRGHRGRLVVKVRGPDRVYLLDGFQCPEKAHRDGLRVWQQIHGKIGPCLWRRRTVVEEVG